MTISQESKLQVLTDHHKDTFQYIREFLKIRDRLFLMVLILIGLQYFQITAPDDSSKTIISFFKDALGFEISANKDILNTILWFGLLAIIVRYFQANVYINRQYNYIKNIEGKITEIAGTELITREGQSYLDEYPAFSNWTNTLYTWIFPILIILTTTYKIISDFTSWSGFVGSYGASFVFFIMILISTILHLLFLHKSNVCLAN